MSVGASPARAPNAGALAAGPATVTVNDSAGLDAGGRPCRRGYLAAPAAEGEAASVWVVLP